MKRKRKIVSGVYIYIYKDLQKNNVIGILGYGIFKPDEFLFVNVFVNCSV